MNPIATFQVLGVVRGVAITERGQRKFKVAEILLDLGEDEALQVEATHERLGAAQRLRQGDVVLITGFVRSRRGGDRWFTSVSALVIAVATGSQVGRPSVAPPVAQGEFLPEDPGPSGETGEPPPF